jgi:hypothetical protein
MLFLLGTQGNLSGVPQQWLKNGNTPGLAKRARHDHAESEKSSEEGPPQTDRRYGPPSTEGHEKRRPKQQGKIQ